MSLCIEDDNIKNIEPIPKNIKNMKLISNKNLNNYNINLQKGKV